MRPGAVLFYLPLDFSPVLRNNTNMPAEMAERQTPET